MLPLHRIFGDRLHYAWIVAGVTFLTLLGAAAVRSATSILIVPLEQAFDWSRAEISAAVSVNLLLYGLMGPFAAALMQRIGLRTTIMMALTLLASGVGFSALVEEPWQLMLTWGVMVGLGTGSLALVLAATVANRWFVERRGLVMGVLTASMASGQLIFLPLLASIASAHGWQAITWTVAGILAVLIPLIFFALPERPSDIGLAAYGTRGAAQPEIRHSGNPVARAFAVLAMASRRGSFWILAGSFFVCGLSTNGLIGTHLIAACFDHGMPEVEGATLLAVMGIFDLVGTTASGWLSDRYDSRWLLFWYYLLRGLSLILLPYSDFTFYGLSLFAVFYGLDWIATVPPTLRLTTDIFGKDDAPIIFGWIFAAHQMGGSTAALSAGLIRTVSGSYTDAFLIAGAACALAALLVLFVKGGRIRRAAAAAA